MSAPTKRSTDTWTEPPSRTWTPMRVSERGGGRGVSGVISIRRSNEILS